MSAAGEHQEQQDPAVRFHDRSALIVHLRTLVYHRMCLTQIEIFRFIRIHFVCCRISAKEFCVLLSTAQPLSPWKSDHDTSFCAIESTADCLANIRRCRLRDDAFLPGIRVNPVRRKIQPVASTRLNTRAGTRSNSPTNGYS